MLGLYGVNGAHKQIQTDKYLSLLALPRHCRTSSIQYKRDQVADGIYLEVTGDSV